MDKCIFVIPVLLYWILPDVMPGIPIDDMMVTMFAAQWFANRMKKKYVFLNN